MDRIADKIADMFPGGGTQFDTADGVSLDDACITLGGRAQHGRRIRNDDGEDTDEVEIINPGEASSDTMLRYIFDDGSAIVLAGDAWDIEADKPFSWECESGK